MSNLFHVSQNSDLISKLDPTHQHESRDMLDFQNKALYSKLLKFHANQNNQTNLKKHDFQWKLICQMWNRHYIRGIETSPGVVLNSDSESRSALHAKQDKLKLACSTVSLKKRDFLQIAPKISNIYISNRSSWRNELIRTNIKSEWRLRRDKWAVKVAAKPPFCSSQFFVRVSCHRQLGWPHRHLRSPKLPKSCEKRVNRRGGAHGVVGAHTALHGHRGQLGHHWTRVLGYGTPSSCCTGVCIPNWLPRWSSWLAVEDDRTKESESAREIREKAEGLRFYFKCQFELAMWQVLVHPKKFFW